MDDISPSDSRAYEDQDPPSPAGSAAHPPPLNRTKSHVRAANKSTVGLARTQKLAFQSKRNMSHKNLARAPAATQEPQAAAAAAPAQGPATGNGGPPNNGPAQAPRNQSSARLRKLASSKGAHQNRGSATLLAGKQQQKRSKQQTVSAEPAHFKLGHDDGGNAQEEWTEESAEETDEDDPSSPPPPVLKARKAPSKTEVAPAKETTTMPAVTLDPAEPVSTTANQPDSQVPELDRTGQLKPADNQPREPKPPATPTKNLQELSLQPGFTAAPGPFEQTAQNPEATTTSSAPSRPPQFQAFPRHSAQLSASPAGSVDSPRGAPSTRPMSTDYGQPYQSRTERKLLLQRAASSVEPAAPPLTLQMGGRVGPSLIDRVRGDAGATWGDGLGSPGSPGGTFGAANGAGAGAASSSHPAGSAAHNQAGGAHTSSLRLIDNQGRIDPQLLRQYDQVRVEYQLVRRHRNLIRESLMRVGMVDRLAPTPEEQAAAAAAAAEAAEAAEAAALARESHDKSASAGKRQSRDQPDTPPSSTRPGSAPGSASSPHHLPRLPNTPSAPAPSATAATTSTTPTTAVTSPASGSRQRSSLFSTLGAAAPAPATSAANLDHAARATPHVRSNAGARAISGLTSAASSVGLSALTAGPHGPAVSTAAAAAAGGTALSAASAARATGSPGPATARGKKSVQKPWLVEATTDEALAACRWLWDMPVSRMRG